VGDGLESDVLGAELYGLDSVWLGPAEGVPGDRRPTHRIAHLAELPDILARARAR